MNKAKDTNKILKLIIVAGISLAMWLLSILYGGLSYETNDDATINLIAAGAYGEGSQYLIYTSALIGYGLKALYAVFGGVNCYLWFYLVFDLLAVVAVSLVISRDMGYLVTAAVTLLANVVLAHNLYIHLQYSQNASAFGVVGFLILLDYLQRNGENKALLLWATLFIALSYSARKENFLFLVPFGLAAIFFEVLPYALKKEKRRIMLSLLVPVAVIAISIFADRYMYYRTPEWADYSRINEIMTDKLDYGNYNFEWNKEEYLEAGFTEWDFRFMEETSYNDIDNFSREKLEKMEEIGRSTRRDKIRFDATTLGETIGDIKGAFGESPLPLCAGIVIGFAIVIAILYKDIKGLMCIVVQALGVFGGSYYLQCIHRTPWRVRYGLWLAALLMVLGGVIVPKVPEILRYISGKLGKNNKGFCVIVGIASLVPLFLWAQSLDFSLDVFNEPEDYRYNLIKTMDEKDALFVMSMDDMYGGLCGARSVMDINRDYAGFYSHVLPVGGWVVPSPIAEYYAHTNGISNVYKSLVDRDDVYYYGGGEHMGYLYVYLNEKYGPGIEVREQDFGDFMAWKFYGQ
ncbi:MAG: hypothetical protein ILA12_10940 [Butyrivibrio sp.]|nr:hypothetical protein [Butyrivibrio sp.]